MSNCSKPLAFLNTMRNHLQRLTGIERRIILPKGESYDKDDFLLIRHGDLKVLAVGGNTEFVAPTQTKPTDRFFVGKVLSVDDGSLYDVTTLTLDVIRENLTADRIIA